MRTRWNVGAFVCAAIVATAGCGPRGSTAGGPSGASPGAAGDQDAHSELKERANKVVRLEGGQIFETVVHYEGGPNESWVVMSHEGRPMQPDLEKKPGAGAHDDKDVPPVAPAQGAWAVPLRVPEWCSAYDGVGQKMFFDDMEKGFLEVAEAGAYVEGLRAVAIAGCDRQRYAPRQRRVQALLQAFVNKVGIDRKELTGLLVALARKANPGSATVAYPCGDDPTVRLLLCGPEGPRKSTGAAARERKGNSLLDKLDAAERSGAVDDKARLALVLSEVVDLRAVQLVGPYREHPTGSFKVVEKAGGVEASQFGLGSTDMLAVVALDVDKMSFAELGRALADKETDPVVKFMVPRRLADVQKIASLQIATVSDEAKAQAKKGMDDWRASYAAHKEDMDAAFAALAAPSDAALCDRADAAYARLLQAKKPATLKAAYLTTLDPAVNVALGAREACHRQRGWSNIAMWEGKLLAGAGSHVGPRRAAVYAMRPGRVPDHLTFLPDEQTVASVKPGTPDSEVAFKPKEWIEERENCTETNKIDRITAGGDIVYRSNCTPLPSIKHTEPYPPAKMAAAAAAGLKKDNVVILVRQDKAPEILFSAHADQKAFEADTGLRAFLGVALP